MPAAPAKAGTVSLKPDSQSKLTQAFHRQMDVLTRSPWPSMAAVGRCKATGVPRLTGPVCRQSVVRPSEKEPVATQVSPRTEGPVRSTCKEQRMTPVKLMLSIFLPLVLLQGCSSDTKTPAATNPASDSTKPSASAAMPTASEAPTRTTTPTWTTACPSNRSCWSSDCRPSSPALPNSRRSRPSPAGATTGSSGPPATMHCGTNSRATASATSTCSRPSPTTRA